MKLSRLVMVCVALMMGLAFVPATFAQTGNAQVRVVHASPDAPAVDVYVDGNAVLTNVPFFTASDYLDLPAGEYRFQVAPTGTSADEAVIDATATVEAGTAYTIAATGAVANIQPTIIVDDLSAPADGEARVKVYHFSPDAPAVDVKLADGTTLVSGLEFPQANELSVPAGTYDIQVTPAGGSDVVIDLAGTALEAGNIYHVFATNNLASITPELTVITPEAPAAEQPATDQPATLPTTSSGNGANLAMFALIGAALLAAGTLLLRRRA